MPNAIKKAFNIATTVLLVLFVVFVILLLGVKLIGLEPHIVLSGSMEPEIRTGSIVYVKNLTPEDAQNLQKGQDVTYVINKQGTKVTHRIYEVVGPAYVKDQNGNFVLDENGEKTPAIDQNGNRIVMYTTYGINNGGTLDGEEGVGNLASTNVIGRPIFSIPLLGYLANFVQTARGRIIAFGFCLMLIIISLFSGSGDSKSKSVKKSADAEGTSPAALPNESSEPSEDYKEGQTDGESLGESPADKSLQEQLSENNSESTNKG